MSVNSNLALSPYFFLTYFFLTVFSGCPDAVIGTNLRKISRFTELFHHATELVTPRHRFSNDTDSSGPSRIASEIGKKRCSQG